MSDGIYDDVISTESKRTEKQRMEMIVDIYQSADGVRDQDFRTETNTRQPLQNTGSDSVKMRKSRAAPVCLVLLCFLLLTAVIVLCVHIHTNNTNYTQERNQLLTRISNITEERDEILTRITNLREEKNQLLTNNTNLFQVNAKLNQEKHKLLECFDGKGVCQFHQSSLYFISSELKNWTESRRDCQQRGADLIIINNKEKHDVVKKMCDDKVWIGLTDIDEEGRWKWVDGSNMTSGFWDHREPNGERKENCVITHKSEWFDYPCSHNFKWICEILFLK